MTRARIHRSGTAAVELAVCLPFLLIVILGVWEVGRMVQAQQIIANAAREGGREIAAGQSSSATVCSYVANYMNMNGLSGVSSTSVTGSVTSGSNTATITGASGLSVGMSVTGDGIPSGTTVTSITGTQVKLSQNATASNASLSMIIGNVSVVNLTNASRSDPTNCNQLDQWQVTVTVPYSTIRYSTVAQISSTTQITASANWFSSKDSPVTVTATIPTN